MMSAQAQGWQRVSEYLHYIWKFGHLFIANAITLSK